MTPSNRCLAWARSTSSFERKDRISLTMRRVSSVIFTLDLKEKKTSISLIFKSKPKKFVIRGLWSRTTHISSRFHSTLCLFMYRIYVWTHVKKKKKKNNNITACLPFRWPTSCQAPLSAGRPQLWLCQRQLHRRKSHGPLCIGFCWASRQLFCHYCTGVWSVCTHTHIYSLDLTELF